MSEDTFRHLVSRVEALESSVVELRSNVQKLADFLQHVLDECGGFTSAGAPEGVPPELLRE